jgi:hypothetical protein
MKSKISVGDRATLANKIATLTEATPADLKRRLRMLYGTEPPPSTRRCCESCRRYLGAPAHPGDACADLLGHHYVKSGGCRFSRGALYELLANPIHIGEIRHKQER